MRRPSILTGALAAIALAIGAAAGLSFVSGSAGPSAARAEQAADDTLGPDTLTPAERAVRAHYRADRGPEQPVPFSHRWHAGELGMECAYCHGEREEVGAVMPMPSTGLCMGCHQWVGRDMPPIGELRAAWENDETIAWNRVYKLPEFVQFSHQAHLRNDIECQECHGPVEEMDRVYKYSDLSMGWCLECHRGEPGPGDVATDHLLVRDADFPDIPAGTQDLGLYPRRIHSGYASNRAPQDCATCHY